MVVDVNVLIYSIDVDAAHHRPAVRWIDAALSGSDPVYFPMLNLIGFQRLTTSRSAFTAPLSVDSASDYIDGWLGAPNASIPQPDAKHFERVRKLLNDTGTGGNLVNDAHVAALAQQIGAPVVSFDNDFSRFDGVDWLKPS